MHWNTLAARVTSVSAVLVVAAALGGCDEPCDRTTSVVVFPVDPSGAPAMVDRVEYRSPLVVEFTVCEASDDATVWACGTNDVGAVQVRLFVGQRIVTADVEVSGDTCTIEGVDLEVVVDPGA